MNEINLFLKLKTNQQLAKSPFLKIIVPAYSTISKQIILAIPLLIPLLK